MDHEPIPSLTRTVGRRTFLRVLGSTAPAAAVTACAPGSVERIIPYVVPPEDVVPGVSSWYATVCAECPAGCGMLVRTREGRAVKVEGNPKHPVNRGSLCIRGQASLQGLYNPDRFRGPHRRRVTDAANGHSVLEPVDWSAAESLFVEQLRSVHAGGQIGRIAVVTRHMTGTLDELVDAWAVAMGARRLRFEPFAYEAIREANRRTFGVRAVPRYDLATPDVVLSFGADFLETWLSTVEHSRDLAGRRRRSNGRRSHFVQLEPRLSLTGASADEQIDIEPGTEGLIAAAMVHTIVSEGRVGETGLTAAGSDRVLALVADHTPDRVSGRTGVAADAIIGLARRFADPSVGPGRSVALGGGVASTGEKATSTLVAINLLNYVAGNVGVTVIFDAVDDVDTGVGWTDVGTHRDLRELTEAMRSGEIDLLVLHDVNPIHATPGGAEFSAALEHVPMVVSTSSCPDETSKHADLVLPTHTPLESWGDVVPRGGIRGLMQPVMAPVFDTKPLGDLLLDTGRAVGAEVAEALPAEGDFLELLQARWRQLHTRVLETSDEPGGSFGTAFEAFWAEAQYQGGFWRSVPKNSVALDPAVLERPLDLEPTGGNRPLALIVYPSLHFYDGRGANRAWLQEIPDPLMKTAWSSWAEIAPETARELGAAEGQLLTVESDHGTLDAPVLINPQLRPGVVAIPLGQGHTDYGRYATGRGVNPTVLLDPRPDGDAGGPRWLGTRVDATPRAVRRPVPRLQTTFTQDGRDIAQAVSLDTLTAGTGAGGTEVHHQPSLYPDHPHPVHRWAMAIDLDACTGCNACVAACYAENNVPVVGADGIRGGRTMSWLRIDRFIEAENGGSDTRFVPMLCQHCDHAPCETVCPTYATYHTDEGLNAQVYNRCVGTRYCANNCPYKVRRFNWHHPEVPEPLNLQLNPDVTTRIAGVMEKCTFCVQRIKEGQDRAQDRNQSVRDGEITPACAQTCPSQAIVFGDRNDPTSRVSALATDPRAYRVLETLNTRPAVTYLKKVLRA